MPAKDRYHDNVVHALVKDGWKITHQQFTIVLPERYLWIDLRASNAAEQRIILVEIKGLEGSSPIEILAAAVGKYVLYRSALHWAGFDDMLYLAVPRHTAWIFSETIGKQLIDDVGIHLIIFDIGSEEIVEWIT